MTAVLTPAEVDLASGVAIWANMRDRSDATGPTSREDDCAALEAICAYLVKKVIATNDVRRTA